MTIDEAKLLIYREHDTIPLHYYYQAQSFVRMVWADGDNHDIDYALKIPSIHVVLAKGKLLLSYACIIWRDVLINRTYYNCYGICSVMTYPKFRKRGYGGQVVKAATALIQNETPADFALLWTDPDKFAFYQRYGWIPMPRLVTTSGDRTAPNRNTAGEAMMIFCSEKGQSARKSLDNGEIYVGESEW